jgi:hypothetical protein
MAVSNSNSSQSQDETDPKHRTLYVIAILCERFVNSLIGLYYSFTALFKGGAPPAPKDSLDDASILPEATAGWFSLVTFGWMSPLMSLGYARTLQPPDLYKLQDNRSAAYIADRINVSYEARKKKADAYNARLANGEIKPGWRAIWWTIRGNRQEKEKEWRERTGRKKASLAYAMNDSIKWWFWSGGILKVIGDTAQVTTPLLVKVRYYICRITWFVNLICNRPLSPIPPSLTTNIVFPPHHPKFPLLEKASAWCLSCWHCNSFRHSVPITFSTAAHRPVSFSEVA